MKRKKIFNVLSIISRLLASNTLLLLIFSISILIFNVFPAQSQDHCDAILQHGIYNTDKYSSSSDAYLKEHRLLCTSTFEQLKKYVDSSGGLEVFDIGVLSADNMRDFQRIYQKSMCHR